MTVEKGMDKTEPAGFNSEQTTVVPDSDGSTPRSPTKETARSAASEQPRCASKRAAAPPIGSAPPGHWMDLARAGFFQEPPPKSTLEKLTDSITDSMSSLTLFKKKPNYKPWGSAPTTRREWYYLKGDQQLPLGPNRWEPFSPEEMKTITDTELWNNGFRGLSLLADVSDDRQVWVGLRPGNDIDLLGLHPGLWHPNGEEIPDSALLKAGKARVLSGHFMSFTKDHDVVEEYYEACIPIKKPWGREKPHVQAVLLVEETIESAVEEHSGELLTNPDYVIRAFNDQGLPVIGFKKNEIEDHAMRELRFRFEEIWHRRKGNPVFVAKGKECHPDDLLKALMQRRKPLPLDIHVMYITDEQMKLKREGMGTITDGRFVDLNMEGYFNNMRRISTVKQPQCCTVS